MFWDSGNPALIMPPESVACDVHMPAGDGSSTFTGALLTTAGNMFVGEFLGTENTTKGILGWGRPWTTRPKALKGYIKYSPQAITHVDSSVPFFESGVG